MPPPPGGWIFRDPFAGLWLRPWFDRTALALITRWYLPLSRAWAAALSADGDIDRFWHELPAEKAVGAGLVKAPLGIVRHRRRVYAAAERNWEAVFFGSGDSEVRTRIAAEMLMLGRGAFVPLALRSRLPAVRFEIPPPDELTRHHRHRLAGPDAAFPAPKETEIARSHSVPGPVGEQYWLRFPTPNENDLGPAWAHVFEPEGVAEPATLIFLHGITMEMEFWPDSRDPIPALAARGIRVIRPEGPWHGRRRKDGYYGGEPALARAPVGMIELFEAWVAEVAALVRWARETSPGPVAVGGISLGALTSQLVATAARTWPAEVRPDALFLCSTSGDIGATMEASSLATALDLPKRLKARGWSEAVLAPWLGLAEPGESAIPPENIVMVLGSVDDVTPFAGGLALAERWGVPAENRFIWRRGHFSAGLAIMSEEGPLARLAEVVKRP
ncbi:MAG: alpha/beta hydrolase family protein [Alphaproteobacteria bacterium]|nr:alpha/beta hydrolase family protein [Alphaproteobacteria bacterium]